MRHTQCQIVADGPSCVFQAVGPPHRHVPRCAARETLIPRQNTTSVAVWSCQVIACGPNVVPPSPVIAAIQWAPKESIRRDAQDGDNWPVTWADDDALYTTWGDGTGFVPKVDSKLSCGFARVTGGPDDFSGFNIRSSGEQFGQGRAGKKSWGILCVEGTLYLWMGHADQAGCDHPARLVARPCCDVDVCRLVIPRVWHGGLRELWKKLRRGAG